MKAAPSPDADRDRRLDEVLGAYLAALDEGRAPEPAGLVASHPELADGLARFFAAEGRVTRWTAPLRTIAEAARGPRAEPAAAGTRFGDYELLGEIGSGGMGVVYRARQRSLNRVVALKMIGAGRLSTAAERQRFRHEAETAARLDHPRIVPVYEVGEWGGDGAGPAVPFFSMKLFEAGSLADGLGRFAAEPAAAARLVAAIARAVHHAHQRGVLHRDLKPSNILLDAEGRPHVADFGLAKRTAAEGEAGEASLTVPGALVGTPGYMAPEQTVGQPATTATDVYGLGAVLYALLTGRPPFRAGSVLETLEQVRDREPEAPASHNPRADRDLQAVCLKCLAKRPEQRYGSAAALAEDLERWLGGRPIQARPVPAAARLWRWCRRNPALAGLSATAGVAVLVALTALAVGTWLTWRESDQKEAALQAEREERRRAEAKERLARRAVDDYMRVAEEWLASQPNMTETVREFLEKALAFYEELSREQGEGADPAVRFRTAQALHFLARLRTQLGQRAEAEQAYRRQIGLLRDLVAEFPGERKYRFDLFHGYQCLGNVLGGKNQGSETEEVYRAALVQIEQLGRDYPEEPNYRDALASVTVYLGGLLSAREDYEEAERLLRESLQIAEQLDRQYPDKRKPPHFAANAARSLAALGGIQAVTSRVGQAEDSYRRALSVWEQLAAAHAEEPEDPSYRQSALQCRFNLGSLYLDQEKWPAAQACFDQCLPAAERLVREYPKLPGHRVYVGRVHVQRAYCLLGAGRRDEAGAAFERFVKVTEELIVDFKDRHDLKWYLVEQLGTFPVPRLRAPRRAVELAEATSTLSPYPQGLGIAYYRAGRWQESIRELEKEGQTLHRDKLVARLFLAMAHRQNGDKERARRLYDSTAAWMDRHKSSTYYTERCLRAEAAGLLGAETPK
jgi:tetratricopeptide (TPR) repeat protein